MGNKKSLKVIALTFLLISFTTLMACGSNQENVTYKLEENNNSIETSLVADDGKIMEQSSQSITTYDSIQGIESKEDAEALLIPSAEPLQGIEGLDYDLQFEDDHFIETITVDFTVVNLSELPGLNELVENGEENLNLEDAIESLEAQGFEKVD